MLQNSKLSSRFKKSEISNITNKSEETVQNDIKIENEQDEQVIYADSSLNESELVESLLEKVNSIPVWFEYDSVKQKELIQTFIENCASSQNAVKLELLDKLYNAVTKFGQINYLLEQENVTSVYVNDCNSVYIEINGNTLNTEIKLSRQSLNFLLKSIAYIYGKNFDASSDIVNFKTDTLFISLIPSAISQSGIIIIFKKNVLLQPASLIKKSMMTEEIFNFIISIISMKKNIIVSGTVNSGKTTFLDTLLNSCLLNSRSVVIENIPQLTSSSESIIKLLINKNSSDTEFVISNILKMSPEYILCDLNEPLQELSGRDGLILTLKAASAGDAFSKLVCSCAMSENLSEKFARQRVLSEYDYIIHINKNENGVRYISSIIELNLARTSALSMKEVVKFVDNEYVTDFPQPLTSFRANALISEAGSMSSRFLNQN